MSSTFQTKMNPSNIVKSGFKFLMVILATLTIQVGTNSCTTSTSSRGAESENLILVCGDSKVLLVDYAKSKDSIPKIIWNWDAHLAQDLPEEYRSRKFNSVDDCKAVNNGKQILVSSSSGAIAIVNRHDKKVVFYADVPNAHSIELLPGNKIIAAASTHEKGNKLMMFDIKNPDEVVYSDSLYSAHGVVWDAKRESLFALGYDVLRKYKMENEVKLGLVEEWKIPGISGHDLQMAPDGNKLFITEHTGAWVFDLENKEFSKIDKFPDAENMKSINQNVSGQFVYTVPEESWWTYHVRFHNPSGFLSFPEMRVYKARWFEGN